MSHSILFGGKQITGFLFRGCRLFDLRLRVHWLHGITTHSLFRHILIKISWARLAGYFSHDCVKKIPKYYALFCLVHSQAVSRNLLSALSLVIGFVFDAVGDQGARGKSVLRRSCYMIRVRNSRWWYDGSCRGRMLADLSPSKFVQGYREKRNKKKKREKKVRAEPIWLVWISEQEE